MQPTTAEQETTTEIAESLHQFISIWKLIAKPFPQADQRDRPGLAISWADISFPFYNSLFLTEEISDAKLLERRIGEAAAYMRAHSHRGWFVFCMDSLRGRAKEDVWEILAKEGLTPSIPITGMAGDLLPLDSPDPLIPQTLRFVRVTDDKTIKDVIDLNCVAYHLPIESGHSLLGEDTLWKEHAYGFVAYERDIPLSTATVIVNEGCLFVFLVATAPEARRKGYADAVVRHALQTAYAATGIKRTVLHASEAGYSVYKRIGYHPTAKFMGCLLEG
jgi:GNAT superfamily N-acetyltransferase